MDEDDFPAGMTTPGQAESRTARAALDDWLAGQETPPAWVALWQELSAERVEGRRRWDWRKALYIAWSSVPRSQREPKTIEALADLLGLANTGTIRAWRAKDRGIDERIATLPRQLLLGHVADVYGALVEVASSADPRAHQDRKLFLELVGEYAQRSEVEVEVNDVRERLARLLGADVVAGAETNGAGEFERCRGEGPAV